MARPTCRRCHKTFTKRNPADNMAPEYHHLCAPRTRFNWGFWDGRAEQARGATRDVSGHFDADYRDGYLAGVASANAGEMPVTSDDAWAAHAD